jgi:hypothetical protein
MKYREGAVFEAGQRAQVVLDDNESKLAEGNEADFARGKQKLDQALKVLMEFGVDQDRGYRGSLGETAKQRQLRLDLVEEWLKPIAAIARRLLREAPEFAALQLPSASARGHGFTASTRGMAAAASVHREVLVGYGLPESVVEDLNRAVDEFESSLSERDKNRVRRVGATKGLEEATKDVRTVLAVLDARMRRWTRGDETIQRAWEVARRIRRRPGSVSGSSVSAPSIGSESVSGSAPPLAIA